MTEIELVALEYQKKHWILISDSGSVKQLKKQKNGFSCLPNLIWTIIAFIGFVFLLGENESGIWVGVSSLLLGAIMPMIYFISFLFRKDKFITLYIDQSGKVCKK